MFVGLPDDTGSTVSYSSGRSERSRLRRMPVDTSKVIVDAADVLNLANAAALQSIIDEFSQRGKNVLAVVPDNLLETFRSCDILASPQDKCTDMVLSAACKGVHPFLTNRDLTGKRSNFLRVHSSLQLKYSVSSSGEIYPSWDIDDLENSDEDGDAQSDIAHVTPMAEMSQGELRIVTMTYDGSEVDASGRQEMGYLSVTSGQKVRIQRKNSPTPGHAGNKYKSYFFVSDVDRPGSEGWLPEDILHCLGDGDACNSQGGDEIPLPSDEMWYSDTGPIDNAAERHAMQFAETFDIADTSSSSKSGQECLGQALQQQEPGSYEWWWGKCWMKRPDGIWEAMDGSGSLYDPNVARQWVELHVPHLGFAEEAKDQIDELRGHLCRLGIAMGKYEVGCRESVEGPLPLMDAVPEEEQFEQAEVAPWFLRSVWLKASDQQIHDLMSGATCIRIAQPIGAPLKLTFVRCKPKTASTAKKSPLQATKRLADAPRRAVLRSSDTVSSSESRPSSVHASPALVIPAIALAPPTSARAKPALGSSRSVASTTRSVMQ